MGGQVQRIRFRASSQTYLDITNKITFLQKRVSIIKLCFPHDSFRHKRFV
jgi:hypothetical protein